ncbi:cupin domain-containing protein [Sphingomonas sp.]|uniref:cupin domain-containing protein n=1 Tax=Sphingomonas sp. TaxID=28214 RepID=UPI002FD98740
MRLNDDLSVRTLVHADRLDWAPSPAPGVDRRMLFRIGEEKARATSIVRYAPGSAFARHAHAGGEEFLVLAGTFQDETGDFPVGTYVRNPPGSAHAPASADGCVILVKLWQFAAHDDVQVVRRSVEGEVAPARPGVDEARILFNGAGERVMLEQWQAGATVEVANERGLELLVLGGGFDDGTDRLKPWSWLRMPAGTPLMAAVGPEGAQVWYKAAPLLHDDVVPFEQSPDAERDR